MVKRSGKMNNLSAKAESGAKEGLILAADLIAQRATKRAPVDTGRLKRSITRGNPFAVQGGQAISVGSNIKYAPYQELGTRKMRAQPYLRPAIRESERDAAILIARRILSKLVKL